MPWVTIDRTALEYGDELSCILTGAPRATLVPVTLRRMILLPILFAGRSMVLQLPLARPRSLVLWQYLHVLRWLLLLTVLAGVMLFAISQVNRHFPKELRTLSTGAVLRAAALVAAWCVLGIWVKRAEFVRLGGGVRPKNVYRLVFPDQGVFERFIYQVKAGIVDASEIVSTVFPETNRRR